jgi:hypothetical protein
MTSGDALSTRVIRRPSNAWWIVALTCSVVATGMAYSLFWAPLVRHSPHHWIYPFDLFNTVRAARYIGEGSFAYLYSLPSEIVTLPGIAILLTPIVKLSEVLHLIAPTRMFPVPRPSEWLLIGPATMATSAVALAGFDGLARTLGTSIGRRRLLLVAEAAVVWAALVRWGHPEDVIAMGLAALALSRAIDGRTVSGGWLLGAALAMQLYTVLLVPIVVGTLGIRRSRALLARAALLPGAILVALLIPNAYATLHVLLEQPNSTILNHPTPWALVAPHVGASEVAAGPGRILALVGACLLGVVASRRRSDVLMIVWLAGVALALRCLTEAVMDPYYVGPAIAFALVAVAPRSWRRWTLVLASGAALTVLTYYRSGMWWYWTEMAAAFGVILLSSRPSLSSACSGEPVAAPGTDGVAAVLDTRVGSSEADAGTSVRSRELSPVRGSSKGSAAPAESAHDLHS